MAKLIKPFQFCRSLSIVSKLVVMTLRDVSEDTPQYRIIADDSTRGMLAKVADFLENKTNNNETVEQNIYVASTLINEFGAYIVPIMKIREFNTRMMLNRGLNPTESSQNTNFTEEAAKTLTAPWNAEECSTLDSLLAEVKQLVRDTPAKPLFGSFLTDLVSHEPKAMTDDLRFGICGLFTMFGSILELTQQLLQMEPEKRNEADFLFEPKLKAVLRQFKDQRNEKRRLLERVYKETMKVPAVAN